MDYKIVKNVLGKFTIQIRKSVTVEWEPLQSESFTTNDEAKIALEKYKKELKEKDNLEKDKQAISKSKYGI